MNKTRKRTACDRWSFVIRSAASVFTVAVILFAGQNTNAQWGDLTGTFVLDGPVPAPVPISGKLLHAPACNNVGELVNESLVVGEEGGIANVVIYVRSPGVRVHDEYEAVAASEVTLEIRNCRFEPHILTMSVGQTLVTKNTDSIAHSIVMNPPGDSASNAMVPRSGGDFSRKFRSAQTIPIPVVCNIYSWMKSYVVVRDNPYTAITDQAGTFTIKNLPAGELEFQAWHETAGYLEAKPEWKRGRFTLKIADGEVSDLGTIKVKPAQLKL